MGKDLGAIRHRINAGDRVGARRELAELLEVDPDNADAWALLAILLSQPAEQAECYRQILRIDPTNRQAAAWLDVLRPQILESAAPEGPSQVEGRTLKCQECGGVTEVRFVGSLHDKRAFCPYCGSQIDLPDSFGRVERRREQGQLPGGGIRSIDAVVVETRRDQVPGEPQFPEGDEIDKVLRDMDLPDVGDEAAGQERDRAPGAGTGIEVLRTAGARREGRGFLDRLLGRRATRATEDELLTDLDRGEEASRAGSLHPEDIIRLAGGPLPKEERRRCPSCRAVVSRSESRCPWCSALFAAD
jgi:RNA polymerase subunit RPABC4/transcription elongation factor Spt4